MSNARHVEACLRFIVYISHLREDTRRQEVLRRLWLYFTNLLSILSLQPYFMNINSQPTAQKAYFQDCLKKGYAFERFVVTLFNERNFKVSKWRNSLITTPAGFTQNDFSLPDLELLFMRRRTYRFAVECKWRNEFDNGKITWAKQKKISVYKQYERESNIKVFVAIGIGGEPCNPEKLFVSPLQDICMDTEVHESQLLPFIRKPTSRFFYDTIQCKLF
jgi:hypothetical protein